MASTSPKKGLRPLLLGGSLFLGTLVSPLAAQTVFDFESEGQLEASTLVSGDVDFFARDDDQSFSGDHSLRIDLTAPDPFRSFTLDEPTGMTSGTITLWFYDTVGQGAASFAVHEWGLSVVLEDADNPADFGAVEIADLPYPVAPGPKAYYATSGGFADYLESGVTFDSASLPARSIGWHRIDFEVEPTVTYISVNGNRSTTVAAPGGEKNLRLRFMADSASVGGSKNWTTESEGHPAAPGLVYLDDFTFTAALPSAQVETFAFGEEEVDRPPVPMVDPTYVDNPLMRGFHNAFETTTDSQYVRVGDQAGYFAGNEPPLKNIAFDLSGASEGTISVRFHDALGQNSDFDKIGGAIILEDADDPAEFIALEVWNAPYPFGAAGAYGYYFVARPIPAGSGFYSRYFPARSTGWHELTIELGATGSTMQLDGVGADAANGDAVYQGPGLDRNLRLRIMADSPTMGGSKNWQDTTTWTKDDVPDLDILDLEKGAGYLHFDDITLPIATTRVTDWSLY